MIAETLIDETTWAEAPSDPEEAFLFISLAARSKLNELLDGTRDRGRFTADEWRRQYVNELLTVATVLGINGLSSADPSGTSAKMDAFDGSLARVLTRIRAENRDQMREDSVALSPVTKTEIRAELERLREFVNKSNLSDKAKQRLHDKIDAVESELDGKRVSLKTIWILAGAVGTFAASSVHVLADLPQARASVEQIMEKVYKEKAQEDAEEQRLLESPLLQLEDKSKGDLSDSEVGD